jgi:hypothetical protein
MKKFNLLYLFCLFSFFGCKDDHNIVDESCAPCVIDNFNKAEGTQYLNGKYAELQAISVSVPCVDDSNWDVVAVGSKACGGPTGYIAYAKTIDKTSFLKKVDFFTEAQKAYNNKWNVVSDCAMVMPPKSVSCVDGKPKFNN